MSNHIQSLIIYNYVLFYIKIINLKYYVFPKYIYTHTQSNRAYIYIAFFFYTFVKILKKQLNKQVNERLVIKELLLTLVYQKKRKEKKRKEKSFNQCKLKRLQDLTNF
jgi:hypothetical protein